jgi:hypothetical protein
VSPTTICRLCQRPRELRDSHILPAFVFRWLKDTSATGFMRFADEPNRRAQDGITTRLLCDECEGRLGVWERAFANDLFYPYVENSSLRVRCGTWLLKFCASVSWRSRSYPRIIPRSNR